jgi:acyl carrier protein
MDFFSYSRFKAGNILTYDIIAKKGCKVSNIKAMKEENNSKLRGTFSKILQINIEEISEAAPLETLASWDSFNALMLIAELEKEFGIKFSMEEVTNIKTLEDIIKILHKNNVEI